MKRLGLLLLLCCVGPLAAAPADTPEEDDITLAPLADRPAAPGFALQDLAGQTHTLAALRGRVVVVNFWATWCPPCIEEMPSLERLAAATRADGIVVLALNAGDSTADVRAFTRRHQLKLTVLLDPDDRTAPRWGIRGLPTTYVIDPQGRIVLQALGDRRWDAPEIRDRLRQLLPTPRPAAI